MHINDDFQLPCLIARGHATVSSRNTDHEMSNLTKTGDLTCQRDENGDEWGFTALSWSDDFLG